MSLFSQPFHNCLLPNSHRFSTLKATTNPHEVEVAARLLLGTSGQPVQDILRQILLDDSENAALEALSKTLLWGHICPTAPDTLSSVPLAEDLFVIARERPPDIFFAGNQVSSHRSLRTKLNNLNVGTFCDQGRYFKRRL